MAASRMQCLRRIFVEPRLGAIASRARLLSTGLADASSSSEAVRPAGVEGSDGGSKIVGKELAIMRREYEKQISELRKKFAAEEERKRKERQQLELVTRERIAVEKEKRLVIKKEKSRIRALEVVEEVKALRARLEEQRKARAGIRQLREKKHLRLVAKEKESVRQQSSIWIEEKDLERRILDALVDPFYLSGSYGLPDRDGPMSMGDSDEDDDDDED